MPRANYAEHLAACRAYRQTPAGKAAVQRSRAKQHEKRRNAKPLRIDPQPLALIVSTWSRT